MKSKIFRTGLCLLIGASTSLQSISAHADSVEVTRNSLKPHFITSKKAGYAAGASIGASLASRLAAAKVGKNIDSLDAARKDAELAEREYSMAQEDLLNEMKTMRMPSFERDNIFERVTKAAAAEFSDWNNERQAQMYSSLKNSERLDGAVERLGAGAKTKELQIKIISEKVPVGLDKRVADDIDFRAFGESNIITKVDHERFMTIVKNAISAEAVNMKAERRLIEVLPRQEALLEIKVLLEKYSERFMYGFVAAMIAEGVLESREEAEIFSAK